MAELQDQLVACSCFKLARPFVKPALALLSRKLQVDFPSYELQLDHDITQTEAHGCDVMTDLMPELCGSLQISGLCPN